MNIESNRESLCPSCMVAEYEACPFRSKIGEYDVAFYVGELTEGQRDKLVESMINQARSRGCTQLGDIT